MTLEPLLTRHGIALFFFYRIYELFVKIIHLRLELEASLTLWAFYIKLLLLIVWKTRIPQDKESAKTNLQTKKPSRIFLQLIFQS